MRNIFWIRYTKHLLLFKKHIFNPSSSCSSTFLKIVTSRYWKFSTTIDAKVDFKELIVF